jgi:hypothetical protein
MNPANLLLVLSVANAAIDTAKNANALLSKAASEGRDVTDAEVDELVASNDTLSADLIKRLRATA